MKEEIEGYLSDKALIRETAEQIEKNLKASGVTVRIPRRSTDPYSVFLSTISRSIGELLGQEPARLMQYLYKVDLPEHKVKEVFASADDVAGTLAEMVLKREFQKVALRRYFAEKGSAGDSSK